MVFCWYKFLPIKTKLPKTLKKKKNFYKISIFFPGNIKKLTNKIWSTAIIWGICSSYYGHLCKWWPYSTTSCSMLAALTVCANTFYIGLTNMSFSWLPNSISSTSIYCFHSFKIFYVITVSIKFRWDSYPVEHISTCSFLLYLQYSGR